MARFVYADNAATTPVSPTVFAAMKPFYTDLYGNPSSLYSVGPGGCKKRPRTAPAQTVARLPRAREPQRDLVFTSGGSESDNWAIKGDCRISLPTKGKKPHHHHPNLSTTPSCIRCTSSAKKRAFRRDATCDVHEDGVVTAGGHRPPRLREDTGPGLGHVRQQRDRHDPAGFGNRRASARSAAFCSTPTLYRRPAHCRSTSRSSTSTCCRSPRTSSTGRKAWARCLSAKASRFPIWSTAARRSADGVPARKTWPGSSD